VVKRAAKAVACVGLGACLAAAGCKPKPQELSGSAGAGASVPAKSTVDWASVTAVDINVAGPAMYHLGRLADAWAKGQGSSVTLRFENGSVTDGTGHAAPITATEWKGMLAMIDKTPDGKTATRALPGTAGGYRDGLGNVPRHAYYVERGPDNSIVLKVVKPLGDSSSG
jgi:hypothetical protein